MFAKKYAKGIMSLVATLATLIVGALTDGSITVAEGLTIGGALVGTIAVVGIPNTPTNPALKTVAQVAAPILSGLAVAVVTPDGITVSVLLNMVIAAAGVIGVYAVKNQGDDYTRLGATPNAV